MKETALFGSHQELGGKLVEFAGYALPIQYKGISDEHHAVRERVGMFDVSHMGEIFIQGPDALHAVQYLITQNAKKIKPGFGVYS